LEATISVLVTLALSIFTPGRVEIMTLWPCTVGALVSLTTSAAMTLPGTT
jgi:hypothetical protein